MLLGAPGTGKGTQAKLIAEKFKIPQISTGDLLRAAVDGDTPLGRAAKPLMDSGMLVPDEIVLELIKERLAEKDTENGYILDGFPRNLMQAEALDEMLMRLRKPLNGVIEIDVDFDILMQRMAGRQTCVSCGQMYNTFTSPSKLFDHCDKCGGELRQRADDNEETISNRLRIYEMQTMPLIEYYAEQNKLQKVQGIGEIKTVNRAVLKAIDALPDDSELSMEITFDDLEKKVMESVQHALASANKDIVEPASKALHKAEKSINKEAKVMAKSLKKTEKKVVKAAKKLIRDVEKDAKKAKKKVTKAAKDLMKKASKKKATTKKTPVKKKAATKKKPAAKKVAKKATKKVAKKTATKKKPTAKKTATKKKVAKKTAKKPTAKKKVAKKTTKKVAKKTSKKATKKSTRK